MADRSENALGANQGIHGIPTPSGTNVLPNYPTYVHRSRPGFVDIGYVLDAFEAEMSVHDRLLLITLATWTDKSGICFPSLPTISTRSGLDERTIRAGLRRLERAGRLSVTRRNRKVSVIRLHRLASDIDAPSSVTTGDTNATRASDINGPVYSPRRTQASDVHVPLTKEANNQEGKSEPPRYCDKHMPFGSNGAPCGPCGSARVANTEWHKLHNTASVTPIAPRTDPTPMCARHDGYPNTRLMPCEACRREQQAVSA